jgi:2-polyprenyl-3-methyl-5-hydroxy-6-metoxy-1,4-benzoquinol methylase
MTLTHDELIPHYSHIHANSKYGLCPNDHIRAQEVAEFLYSRLKPGQTVLDCSAGRGHLLRLMHARGVQCSATEADPYLIANDLKDFERWCLRYDQLETLQPRKWDAVVSTEVLEHLLSEDEARAAIRSLAALSARWLCLTIGVTESSWYSGLGGQDVQLHYVIRPGSWWVSEVAKVARIVDQHEQRIANLSYVIFAEVENGV